jgi:hypothetical protein
MAKWLRDNGLTVALTLLFLVSLAGQVIAGWRVDVEDRLRHAEAALPLIAYLGSGEFLSALFENWESEFLQMWAYVMLTVYLFQKGSAESKKPSSKARKKPSARAPHRASLASQLYSHFLGLTLGLLFLGSFVLHWLNSARHAADEAMAHGEVPPGALAHLVSADFWFESFQNWQSEFLSTAVLVVLTIWLREKGSPESKKVAATDSETGAA